MPQSTASCAVSTRPVNIRSRVRTGPIIAGQHLAVVGVGDAAVELGHPERGAVADDRHVAAHRDLQAAALAQPVDRRRPPVSPTVAGCRTAAAPPSDSAPKSIQSSPPSPPPRSPPGANTSPVPVMSRPARSSSASTWLTAYPMPKYIAGVIALRAFGRSSVHTPNGALAGEPQERRAEPVAVGRARRVLGGRHASPRLSRRLRSSTSSMASAVRCAVACARDQCRQRARRARAAQRRVRAGQPFGGKHPGEDVARTGGVDGLDRRARARRRCRRRRRSVAPRRRGWSPDAVPANAIRGTRPR